jgi:hypothetical protein
MIRNTFARIYTDEDGNAASLRRDCSAAILAADPRNGGEDRRPTVAVRTAEVSVFICG